jgi:hypothetical protein
MRPMLMTTLRLFAVIMVVVVLATVTTPARADADPLLAAGIASLAVMGAILVAYLIVASGSDSGDETRLEGPERVVLIHVAQAS